MIVTGSYFRRFIIVRSGFLQTKGSAGNGCSALARHLATEFAPAGVRLEFERWRASPRATANMIREWSGMNANPTWEPPQVVFIGYSYGCGYGLTRVGRALGRYGIPIEHAVLCDPIKFSAFMWRAFIKQTWWRKFRIHVPENVNQITWFRQDVSKPSAHDLAFKRCQTVVREPIDLEVPHVEMDNHHRFHEAAINVCRSVFRPNVEI